MKPKNIHEGLESEPTLPPIISRPPPLLPVKRTPLWRRMSIVFLIVGLGLAAFFCFRVWQFVQYAQTHPHLAQSGELEFREANRQIIAGIGVMVFGNDNDARALAMMYSKGLKTLRDNLFTEGGRTALASMEGEFLTYCQLNEDSCVFLVHVPELRKFTSEARQVLAELAWMNAQSTVRDNIRPLPKQIVVGVKGLVFYDVILVGDFVENPNSGNNGIKTRGSGLEDMKLFYPYFAATSPPPETGATNTDIITNK